MDNKKLYERQALYYIVEEKEVNVMWKRDENYNG